MGTDQNPALMSDLISLPGQPGIYAISCDLCHLMAAVALLRLRELSSLAPALLWIWVDGLACLFQGWLGLGCPSSYNITEDMLLLYTVGHSGSMARCPTHIPMAHPGSTGAGKVAEEQVLETLWKDSVLEQAGQGVGCWW